MCLQVRDKRQLLRHSLVLEGQLFQSELIAKVEWRENAYGQSILGNGELALGFCYQII